MDEFWSKRSKPIAMVTLMLLMAAVILLHALPAAKHKEESFGDVSTETVGFNDIAAGVSIVYGKLWLYDLSLIGFVAAAGAAVFFKSEDKSIQCLVITGGCAAALIFPLYVNAKLDDLADGNSLGTGAILFMIACGAAGIICWFLPAESGFPPIPSMGGSIYGSQPVAGGMAGSAGVGAGTIFGAGPTLTLRPASATPGSAVEAIAERFIAGSLISLQWQDGAGLSHPLGQQNAMQIGRAHFSFVVPTDATAGFKKIEASSHRHSATAMLTVLVPAPKSVVDAPPVTAAITPPAPVATAEVAVTAPDLPPVTAAPEVISPPAANEDPSSGTTRVISEP